RGRDAVSLAGADLEHERARACALREPLVQTGADERELRLVAQLRREPVERVDVRRVRDDEIPAVLRGLEAADFQLDVESEVFCVLARERERGLRLVDARDLRVRPLVLECERDRAGSDADVEDARRLRPLEERKRALDEDLGLGTRNECTRVRLQRQPAEAPFAEDVREWLAALPTRDERLEPVHLTV